MAPKRRKNPIGSANSRSPKKRQRQHQAPPAETFPIPERLQDVVERVGNKESLFRLMFPIDHLDGVHRLAWGLDRRADLVIVNLEFLQGENKSSGHARFCVHSSTDREKRSHRYTSTISDPSKCTNNPCSPRSTILTCVLSRELVGLLGRRGCRDLGTIYDRALECIDSDPTKRCLICGEEYEVKVYTPTACMGKCLETLDKWPLRARLSHLLSDTKVLDFMLCCIYTAVIGQQHPTVRHKYGTESSLLVGCPLPLDKIQATVDSFPKLSDELGMQQLVNSAARNGSHRRQLLSWLTLRLRGCIVSLTRDADFFLQGKGLEDSHQFMLLNSRLERQQKFNKEVKKVGVGSVAFHGAKAPRVFNIITDALRNMLSEPYAVMEAGIFYSDTPGYSCEYTEGDVPLQPWKQSQFSGKEWSVLFGVEVALSEIPFADMEHSTCNESTVMIRHVFLLPFLDSLSRTLSSEERWSFLQIDQGAMKKAHRALDLNRLSSRHIGLGAKEEPKGMAALPESQKDNNV